MSWIIKDVKKVTEQKTLMEVNRYTEFSVSFLILLISSGIISTLGLLINSIPVIIGGMIVSPLMWPLIKISLGISFEDKKHIIKPLILLIFSILITLGTAFLITKISPIKDINDEIIVRTNPTLMDALIALASGTVAAFGVIQPKISRNLAGVAVATSLMPPLCVSGIGLALAEYEIFTGGLFLFLANIVAIIFVVVLIFSLLEVKNDAGEKIKRGGLIFTTIILILTAIPLFRQLMDYSFESGVYEKAQMVLEESFEEISPSIHISNIRTNYKKLEGEGIIYIEAEIELPEDVSINYRQQQDIIKALESEFDRKVDLDMLLSRTLSVVTESDIEYSKIKTDLEKRTLEEIEKQNSSVSVDKILVTKGVNAWNIMAVLHADPDVIFTYNQRDEVEENLAEYIDEEVFLDIEIILQTSLKQEEDLMIKNLKRDIQTSFIKIPEGTTIEIEISSINLREIGDVVEADIEIKAPTDFELKDQDIEDIKEKLSSKYGLNITMKVALIYQEIKNF